MIIAEMTSASFRTLFGSPFDSGKLLVGVDAADCGDESAIRGFAALALAIPRTGSGPGRTAEYSPETMACSFSFHQLRAASRAASGVIFCLYRERNHVFTSWLISSEAKIRSLIRPSASIDLL